MNGLTIAEQEYGIKNICLYYDKYIEASENKEYEQINQLTMQEIYKNLPIARHLGPKHSKPWTKLYHRTDKKEKTNNLLYWPMSGYQKAQHRIPVVSTQTQVKYINKRVNSVQHIKSLSNEYDKNAQVFNTYQLQAGIYKQSQMDWIENQPDHAYLRFRQTQFRANKTKYTPNTRKHRV